VVACSTIGPPSMTTMVSALRIVDSRCAMTRLVRPRRRRAIASLPNARRTSSRLSRRQSLPLRMMRPPSIS
jgi:hypothetical protein